MSPRVDVRRPTWPLIVAGFTLMCIVAAWMVTLRPQGVHPPRLHLGPPLEKTEPPLPRMEDNVVKTLTTDEALAANASVPFSQEPIEAAPPFNATQTLSGDLAKKAAVDCLTAAVYYEAGGQGEAGQRAVAQVVLNRVRHPAFPSSVCGVVYQGSDRPTGCQFTFTCDGSLARKPTADGWSAARRIADDALAGKVDRAVGMATHYHANYVVPYWASNLTKIAAVGDHIFYRWPGYWGRRDAFRQLYTGETTAEGQLAAPPPMEAQTVSLGAQLTAPAQPTPLADAAISQLVAESLSQPPQVVQLRADQSHGTLRIDDELAQSGGSAETPNKGAEDPPAPK